MSPVTVNTYLRHIKCFYLWTGRKWELPWLKEERNVLQTLSEAQVRALIAFRPTGTNTTRAPMAALAILDTGVRASELSGITLDAIDWDSLVLKVHGKGNKHRLVPFSFELRKRLYPFVRKNVARFVFGTRHQKKVTVRNLERDFTAPGTKVGITALRFSPHTLRHTFAVSCLRRGGNIYSLSRLLGHTTVKTAEIYLRSIGIDDLKRNHSQLSPLSQR